MQVFIYILDLCYYLSVFSQNRFETMKYLNTNSNSTCAYSQLKGSICLPCKQRRAIRFILLFLLMAFILLLFILESYYRYCQCAVTKHYSEKNIRLAHQTMNMLNNLSITYWPDCQSLLNVLRNETYNTWDQDVDFSIEWPLETNHIHSELNDIQIFIKTLEHYNFSVEYYPSRKLFSLSSRNETSARQPHVDIWLWTRHYKTNKNINESVIELFDYSLKYQTRLLSDIYPLVSVRWLERNIKIPFQAHKIAFKEYGASYMTAIAFRGNCFHNLVDGRWIYGFL